MGLDSFNYDEFFAVRKFLGQNPESWLEIIDEDIDELMIPMEKHVSYASQFMLGSAHQWLKRNLHRVSMMNWCDFSYSVLWEFDKPYVEANCSDKLTDLREEHIESKESKEAETLNEDAGSVNTIGILAFIPNQITFSGCSDLWSLFSSSSSDPSKRDDGVIWPKMIVINSRLKVGARLSRGSENEDQHRERKMLRYGQSGHTHQLFDVIPQRNAFNSFRVRLVDVSYFFDYDELNTLQPSISRQEIVNLGGVICLENDIEVHTLSVLKKRVFVATSEFVHHMTPSQDSTEATGYVAELVSHVQGKAVMSTKHMVPPQWCWQARKHIRWRLGAQTMSAPKNKVHLGREQGEFSEMAKSCFGDMYNNYLPSRRDINLQ